MANKDTPQKINYLPNDPTTPGLMGHMDVPVLPKPCPPFNVVGWSGGGGIPGTPRFQAALVYATIATALNIVQSKVSKPLEKWAATPKLVAFPRAGNQLNAYYDRSALKFFYNLDAITKKIVFSCESSDVVSHELGHAILDAMRPDLWNTASLEIFAFHEAFGDIMAVSTVLEHPAAIDLILKETGGDMTKPNSASRVAEEMGQAIYHATSGRSGKVDCLRNAVNNYAYVDPDNLPSSGAGLVKESHSFSQVFTGAWYDCLAALYTTLVAEDKLPQADALKKARDLALTFLLRGVVAAPNVHEFYSSVAKAMITATRDVESGRFAPVLTAVFHKRKILSPTFTSGLMALFDTGVIDPSVEGHKAHVDLAEPILGLSKIVVDIPTFAVGAFTAEGSSKHCLHRAARAVKFAHQHNLIGTQDDNRMFFVANGKLRRNYICNAFCPECNK